MTNTLRQFYRGKGGTALASMARWVLGITMVYASIDKIIHPLAFSQNVQNYSFLQIGRAHV